MIYSIDKISNKLESLKLLTCQYRTNFGKKEKKPNEHKANNSNQKKKTNINKINSDPTTFSTVFVCVYTKNYHKTTIFLNFETNIISLSDSPSKYTRYIYETYPNRLKLI